MKEKGVTVRGAGEGPAYCRYCGAARSGVTLPVLETEGEARAWHFCDFCWALLRHGFQVLRPGEDLSHFHEPHGLCLRSQEVYVYIREGFVQYLRSAGRRDE